MAAIICDGIGKICSSCGEVCVLPCRILSKVCGSACDIVSKLCSGPFCVYSIVTVALNSPSIIISGKSLVNGFLDCKGSLWLLINLILCVTNIAAAWYLSAKSQNRNDPDLQGNSTLFSRIVHLLCYDPVIAVYIILLLFWFCWLGVGVQWRISDKIYEGDRCENNIEGKITTCIALGYSFFSIGCIALGCTLCVAGCDGRKFNDGNAYHADNDSPTKVESPTKQENSYKAPSSQPVEDAEINIPVATPVNEKNGKHFTKSTIPDDTEAQPVASAPPLPSKSASTGAAVGSKIGKILSVDNEKQAMLQQKGAYAGEVVGGGISAVKNFIGLKK